MENAKADVGRISIVGSDGQSLTCSGATKADFRLVIERGSEITAINLTHKMARVLGVGLHELYTPEELIELKER